MSKVQKEQEKDQKIQSVRKALENGEIKENEANAAILSLEAGISQFVTAALRPEKDDALTEWITQKMAGEGVGVLRGVEDAPTKVDEYEVFDVASELLSLRKDQGPEIQRKIDEILERRDLRAMKAAVNRYTTGAKKYAEVAASAKAVSAVRPGQDFRDRETTTYLLETLKNTRIPKETKQDVKKVLAGNNPTEQRQARTMIEEFLRIDRQEREAAFRAKPGVLPVYFP